MKEQRVQAQVVELAQQAWQCRSRRSPTERSSWRPEEAVAGGREISGPLILANKITFVPNGSGAVGAAKMIQEVLDILSCLPKSMGRLTVFSISQVNHKPLGTA
ncbi:hypothetical protein HPG69_009686 [Diceros bicornis minor]|uniref:Uncharacterized protein n=1 Tax=Diceros bicornis minor TaxID=77932 RepID=A0A7J7EYB6_DICBM|nr:hypothetical protein HPG69_009686 [Diceros bicornis minor]